MEQNPLEKPTVNLLLKKFPAFYGSRRFITVIGLGAIAASELDKVFSGYQPR
jgi:hypothetical protein